MKIPRNLHGRDFANHLIRLWQFVQVNQAGSHIILRTLTPTTRTISVPAHKPLKVGTLKGLLDDIARNKNVTPEDILRDL